MKKRMIKLMTIFCMAGILTVNPVIIGLAEETDAVGADVSEEEPVEEETEEPEEADEKTDKEVTEEEPETETVESEAEIQESESAEILEEKEAEEVSETVTMSANDAAMPAVMAAENEIATQGEETCSIIYKYNTGNNASHTDSADNIYSENKNILVGNPPSGENKRTNYDFIGWEKDGKIYQPGDTYTATAKDVTDKNITFIAVWRQQVTIKVDGAAASLEAKDGATAMSVAYKLSETESSLTAPDNYEFANKWVINDNKTPCDATNTMTVKFEDKNNTQVYNAVSVNVDGNTDVPIENNTINLYSCWNPKNGSDFRITNRTSGNNFKITASNNHKVNFYNGTAYIDTVSDNDKLTFEANKWKLEKSVNELKAIASQSIYVTKSENDVRYYQCHELTIKDSDFKRMINITYQDTYSDTDTRFLLDGKDEGTTVSMSDIIHAGIEESWAKYLNKDITAERGEYQFSRWKFLWNEEEYSENEIKNQTIDFYNDNTHSLTVQPVWNGSYTCDANYPGNQGDGKEPKPGIAEVGTNIVLPTVKDIDGKYIFKGWLDSEEKTYKGGASYPIKKANETFTGQWKAVPHKLKFMDEDGTVYREGEADFNTPITWPSEPTKEGYTFQNWVVELDENEREPVKHGSKFTMQDQDITFIAQWFINSYQISYDGNGATMGVPAETVEQNYQTDYTIDTVVPTKTGYTFQGWSDGTTTYQPGAAFKVPAKNVVLTAQWKINSHQVKYDGNGGTKAPGSQQVDYNSKVTPSGEASRDGYTFVGWERISTGEVLSSGHSFVMPDMDETLKAKWKVAHSKISGKGSFYLVSEQSYTMGSGVKVQGDSSNYSENITFYVPQSGYYTFE